MNRLKFAVNKTVSDKKKIFCLYLTLGYPSVDYTMEVIPMLCEAGVDILELGIPFSDPLADGPTIQTASYSALKNGVSVKDSFSMMKKLRKRGLDIPVIFFSYYNIIYNIGHDFPDILKESGFDAVLSPDLPPEEGSVLSFELKRKGIDVIYLVSPTTTAERVRYISNEGGAFIYYVSRKGVTGARNGFNSGLKSEVLSVRKISGKPVLVGFGISSPEDVRVISSFSDGVIVGSAVVEKCGEMKPRELIKYVKNLSEVLADESSCR